VNADRAGGNMDALAMFFMEIGICVLVAGIVVAVLTEPLRLV